jgi:peptide/nickel transport system substrate-binding protein
MRTLLSVAVLVLLISVAATPAAAAPDGQVTWGVHISLAPTWFDPAETPGIVTPFMVLYGLTTRC